MKKLDLNKIPLQDRNKIFIIEEDIDRIVWEICAQSILMENLSDKNLSDSQLLTIDEFKIFSGDTCRVGDILLWNAAKKKYVKIEKVGKEDLEAFLQYLIGTLFAKEITINQGKLEKNDKSNNVDTGVRVKGRLPKTKQESSVGVNFHSQTAKEILESVSSKYTLTDANKGKKISDEELISEENHLKESGLLDDSENPYGVALTYCKGKGKGTIKYDFYKYTKDDLSWAVKIGANLADLLGIEAFAKYHGVSETVLSSSCRINVSFKDDEDEK